MSSRKNIIVIFLILIVAIASSGIYVYIKMYRPLVEDTKKIESSIATVKNEISTLSTSTEVDTKELMINTANLQKKLPVAILADQFVLLLEKAEVASGSRITNMDFNKDENTEAAASNTAEQNLVQTQQNEVGATTSTSTLPAGVKRLTVTLTVEAPSYLELEAFVKELEELPRITKLDSLSFSGLKEGATPGVLTYNVVTSTYYYPDLTDLKNQLPDYEVPAPSKKTNPLYEAEEEVIVEVPQTDSETKVDPTNGTKNAEVDDNSNTDNQNDTKVTKKNGKAYKVTSYQVQPGDTFFELAVKFYNNNKGMELIKSWNQITELQSGVTIEIPIPIDGEI